MRRFRSPLLLTVAFLIMGCGGGDDREPVYPVHGQVLYQGRPAEGALVAFHPIDGPDAGALKPHGRVEADGSFRLGTYEADDGAPAGEYAGTVDWPDDTPGPPGPRPDRLRGRYSDPQASPFQVQIREGTNELEPFQLR